MGIGPVYAATYDLCLSGLAACCSEAITPPGGGLESRVPDPPHIPPHVTRHPGFCRARCLLCSGTRGQYCQIHPLAAEALGGFLSVRTHLPVRPRGQPRTRGGYLGAEVCPLHCGALHSTIPTLSQACAALIINCQNIFYIELGGLDLTVVPHGLTFVMNHSSHSSEITSNTHEI